MFFPYIYERYLAKKIYLSFLFVLSALVILFIFFDFINEISDVYAKVPNLGILIIILFRIPNRIIEMMPISILIASIYVLSNMAIQSEYIVLRVGGLSTKRLIYTFLKIALPLILFFFLISELIIPLTRNFSKDTYFKTLRQSQEMNKLKSGIWIRNKSNYPTKNTMGSDFSYINIGSIDFDGTICALHMYEFDINHRLLLTRFAKFAKFYKNGIWDLYDGTETQFQETTSDDPLDIRFNIKTSSFKKLTLVTEVNPKILNAIFIKSEYLSISHLLSYVDFLKENKQDYQRHATLLWKKFFYPITIVVMLLLSVPFSYLQNRSSSIGYRVFGGIMIGISFQLFSAFFSHLGLLLHLSPWITAFTPSGIYLISAIFAILYISRL